MSAYHSMSVMELIINAKTSPKIAADIKSEGVKFGKVIVNFEGSKSSLCVYPDPNDTGNYAIFRHRNQIEHLFKYQKYEIQGEIILEWSEESNEVYVTEPDPNRWENPCEMMLKMLKGVIEMENFHVTISEEHDIFRTNLWLCTWELKSLTYCSGTGLLLPQLAKIALLPLGHLTIDQGARMRGCPVQMFVCDKADIPYSAINFETILYSSYRRFLLHCDITRPSGLEMNLFMYKWIRLELSDLEEFKMVWRRHPRFPGFKVLKRLSSRWINECFLGIPVKKFRRIQNPVQYRGSSYATGRTLTNSSGAVATIVMTETSFHFFVSRRNAMNGQMAMK